MQICRTCKKTKGWDDFSKKSRYKSGYDSQCRVCVSSDSKRRRLNVSSLQSFDNALLTIDQVAALFSVGISTVNLWKSQGKILFEKIGGVNYVSKDSINEFLNS